MERAKQLPKIMVDLEAVITLEMIATGVLSPNEGFMNEADYKSVLNEGKIKRWDNLACSIKFCADWRPK